MSLTVRYPDIDFEKCFPRWAPHLEFAMQMNSYSIIPVNLEPFIVKVFLEAKKQLDPVADAQLIDEVNWFIGQEAQHYRQHERFNEVFETPRYPEVAKLNKQYGEDLAAFRRDKSLIFNLAYTEGFESAGAVFYQVWFEKLRAYREGAAEEALLLYDWHFAEEFEHREVAYKLYMRLAARGNIFRRIWYGYFYRIYGVLKMMAHAGGYLDAIRKHLLAVERQSMTADEVAASKRREKSLGSYYFRHTVKGLLGVLSPFYHPANKPPPEGLEALLAEFDEGGRYARTSSAGKATKS